MPLTLNQLEERRISLEKYLQLLSQDPRISNGIVFNGFLLAAQQETASEKADEVDLEVYLMNDSKVNIHGLTILQTAEILEVSILKCILYKGPKIWSWILFLSHTRARGMDGGSTPLLDDLTPPL